MKETIKKIDPIKTWKPWKPVVIKKVEPKILSEMENWAWEYSKIWKAVNITPKKIVIFKEVKAEI